MPARPLSGVRVLDASDAVGEAATRLLADLGAETVRVEPPGGSPTRTEEPRHGDQSLPFLVRNANKAHVVATDAAHLLELAAEADVVVLDRDNPWTVDAGRLRARHPWLVVVVSSPFGSTGPRNTWQATESTLLALSGSLSRSGRPGAVPLLPPAGLAHATAAAQLAWTALVAYHHRLRTGRGQLVDLSHAEAVATGLDPAYGVQGSAAAGRSGKIRRDRPPADSYPVYPCADGFVRLCLLAPRQWQGMFGWLGSPAEFADPKYASISARVEAGDRLNSLINDLFSRHTAAELVEEAARRGIPLAQVLTLGEAVRSPHFVDGGSVDEIELAPGLRAHLPTGFADVGGERLGIRAPYPADPATDHAWLPRPEPETHDGDPSAPDCLPFSGLRVLDLGVIVFGAEIGRAFADLGADVIKVESLAFPDGLRQTRRGEAMNASFAWGQRNKRSLGLDLRSPEGLAIFRDLVARSDVVLSNFKPGTLASLGIDHERLAAINPRIVVVESAAFSSRGGWAKRLGYGPLVRAACGISSLWKYDADETECWDGVTVYPDHVAARIGALTVAAALVERRRTGRGTRIELAQSDVVLHQLAPLAAAESLAPGTVRARGNRDRHGFGDLFACAGDDEWCVIEARTPAEEQVLRVAVGASPDEQLHAAVARWAARRTPDEAMQHLQGAGIPAAAMRRLNEIAHDPQLQHRGSYAVLRHPAFEGDLPTEESSSPFETLPPVATAPAPMPGEHTRVVLTELLGYGAAQVETLLARGVVHEAPRA
ncbi:CaiB/BaiF CoA-transferase family protein [Nocardioides daejeonensis]|uniref:CaiB/BaiF CoA-transferase family protein n=1 Tax=Nocardioides daejeonensis TaxID=1046556 RepID=UPI000D745DC2|nr:CoA transferase [Nocardioides daejeonensis]